MLAFDETVHLSCRLDPTAWRDLVDDQVRTGGGTDFTDLFNRAARLHPSILVVMTDLDATLPPVPGFPVLWVVPGRVETPPFGKLLFIGETWKSE